MSAENACRREDLELVRRILRGDRSYLPRLAERLKCVPRILSVRNARSGHALDEHELADLSQDVLLIVWRKLDRFEGLSVLPAWVYRICALEFQNAVRQKYRGPRPLGEASEDASETLEPTAWRDPDPSEFDDVHRGLQRIGKEEALVIRLKHFQGCTFDEIGRQLGISPNTAKDRYYRGLRELRPLLREREPERS